MFICFIFYRKYFYLLNFIEFFNRKRFLFLTSCSCFVENWIVSTWNVHLFKRLFVCLHFETLISYQKTGGKGKKESAMLSKWREREREEKSINDCCYFWTNKARPEKSEKNTGKGKREGEKRGGEKNHRLLSIEK